MGKHGYPHNLAMTETLTETLGRHAANRGGAGGGPSPATGGARRAKIVCTIGPATGSPERIAALVDAGMDIARLNFSHGRHDDHATVYAHVRAASDAAGRAVGVLADLQGPKLRIGGLLGGVSVLAGGARLLISVGRATGTPGRLSTTYPALAILGRIKATQVAGALGTAAVFFVLGRLVWLRSISKYTSAGG